MSNTELVQKLSEGYTSKEIAVECGVNYWTLRKRIIDLKVQCLCKTIPQLVANFFRRGLIS